MAQMDPAEGQSLYILSKKSQSVIIYYYKWWQKPAILKKLVPVSFKNNDQLD